jgi:hypothetical protein
VANNKDAGKTAESGEGDPWSVVAREIEENGENGRLAASCPALSFLRVRTVTVGVKTGIARLSASVSHSHSCAATLSFSPPASCSQCPRRPNVPANPPNDELAVASATLSIASPKILTAGDA